MHFVPFYTEACAACAKSSGWFTLSANSKNCITRTEAALREGKNALLNPQLPYATCTVWNQVKLSDFGCSKKEEIRVNWGTC